MNLVEKWVSNITFEGRCERYPDFWKVIADTNCYGNKKEQEELMLTNGDFQSVKKNGFYLC